MDLGTAPQGETPTVVLLGDTLTWVQPPSALLDMVDMLDSETAAEATALEQKSTTYPALVFFLGAQAKYLQHVVPRSSLEFLGVSQSSSEFPEVS